MTGDLGAIEYNIRMFAPELGRWLMPDVIIHFNLSPYQFCSNNPIVFIDENGMDWYKNNETNAALWRDSQESYFIIDGLFYFNIGAFFTKDLEDGSSIIYFQNDILKIIDADMTAGETFDSDLEIKRYFGPDFDVEVVPVRDNVQISKEIINFALSPFGITVMDRRGPTMPPLYGPFKSLPSSRDLGVGKGSTKNERKINPKRKEVAEEKIKTLRRDKALAKTKKEKK